MGGDDASPYAGVLGAFRYTFRATDSWLLRGYVLASAAVGGFTALLVLLGVVYWFGNAAGLIGELALLPVVGILLLGPLLAPVLIAARRYRRGVPVETVRLAGLGWGFLIAVAVALVIADPTPHAWPVSLLDGLPWWSGFLAPIGVAAAMVATFVPRR